MARLAILDQVYHVGMLMAVADTGQITTREGVEYDYETKPSYCFTLKDAAGNGGTASIDVTVNLTNVDDTTPGGGIE